MSIDNIKVGDYVRTKKRGFQFPQIARIESISMKRDRCYRNQYYLELDHNLIPDYEFHIYEKYIEKSSPNIIDLIEVGDYVNGCKIIDICINEITNLKYLETDITEFDNIYACGHINIYEKDIESIVTKEQFESMEYKIEK